MEKKIPNATALIYINQCKTDKQNLDKKIGDVDKKKLDTSGLVTTTVLNAKISEVENKIPDTSSLVATTVPTTKMREIEKKIPDHVKYVTTQEFNNFTTRYFSARLKQANLVGKTNFGNKLISFNRKITSNKTRYLES